jgi:RNA polymerase sigma factor (sigma-70 family)
MRREVFERLYSEHAQGLFGFLSYRTGDRVLAEDLLADTFERVLRTKRRYDPRRGSEKTWLYSIALNLLRDHARRSSAERRALERQPAPTVAAAAPEVDRVAERDALSRAIATLSDEEREALALRYGAEMTMPEIARLLDEKLTTVDGRVHRALRKLRAELL